VAGRDRSAHNDERILGARSVSTMIEQLICWLCVY
jgi:hypothetical protein